MNDVKIEIKLNPLTDGIVQTICIDKAERQDQRALVIATNGDMKQISLQEAMKILDGLKDCSGSIIIGDSDYIVIFNDDKAFDTQEGRYFVGSMLIMRIDGDRLVPLAEEEIQTARGLLSERMREMTADDLRFSALELS
ncbi:MAG: hypothetical protein KA965_09345 [Butyrivibrio sp.]|nr:hypothetical protein [Butyrivibrio sp.]